MTARHWECGLTTDFVKSPSSKPFICILRTIRVSLSGFLLPTLLELILHLARVQVDSVNKF